MKVSFYLIICDLKEVKLKLNKGRRSSTLLSEIHPHSQTPVPDPLDELSPYERLLHGLHHDERWLKEVTLGKRVGFYRFRGDLGSGNFSQVKLANHQLTKGQYSLFIIH